MVPDFRYFFDTRSNQRSLALYNYANLLSTKAVDPPLLRPLFHMLKFVVSGDSGD
jgi:hypothetical protein